MLELGLEHLEFPLPTFADQSYSEVEPSRKAHAFTMRSSFADQPCSEVARKHGESAKRGFTTTY